MTDREIVSDRSNGTDTVSTGRDGIPSVPVDGAPVLARLARPRSEVPTRIALLSDCHVSTEKHGTWKVFHRTQDRLRTALADCNERGVDAVVFAGDLTKDGARADFEWIDSALADLDSPAVAVPGNHDVPKTFDEHETPPVSEFAEQYAPDTFPFRRRFGGVDVIGVNSASAPDRSLADTHGGGVSEEQLAWLDRTLPEATNPVVVTHHNLPGLDTKRDDEAWLPHPPVGDSDALVDVLARHDVPLHVSGHVHLPAVTGSDGVRGLVCSALCSFPQSYQLLDVDETGTTVRYVPVATEAEIREAHEFAKCHSDRSEAITDAVVRRLGRLPLVEDEEPLGQEASPVRAGAENKLN